MNDVIGQLLPLAVGVAISPIPIIAAILMLLAAKAGGTSVGFPLGWVAGTWLGRDSIRTPPGCRKDARRVSDRRRICRPSSRRVRG